jgi:hypothetical protein
VSALRGPLSARFFATKIQDEVFTLPPPEQVAVMSLGYRSALADVIFAHVLVSAGLHFQEKRSFQLAARYVELITSLDPRFEAPYRMAASLITLQAKPATREDYRDTRRILEQGMAAFPFSQELWLSTGQFLAYLGPTGEIEGQELADWKLAGGRALAHACELVGSKERPPYDCIVAAGLLTKAGEAEASREFIERTLAVSDDPRVLEYMSALLKKSLGDAEHDRVQSRRDAFKRAWGTDLPFVSRGALLTIGPAWNSAACAGVDATCPTSWRAWAEALEERQGARETASQPLGGTP